MKKNILKQIITDKNLAWDKTLGENSSEFFVKLSLESIDELKLNISNLQDKCINNFPLLSNDIKSLKNEKIIHGAGLFIIDGNTFSSFSRSEIKGIYEIISMILGKLLEQDIKGSKIIKIKDRGKSLSTGGRYHQTSDGGSYHTDGPHWRQPPDIIGMLCINPALKGGVSKFISVYTIHNEILKMGLDKLEPLYKDFFFDRREEVAKDLRTIAKPIFDFANDKLYCRFLKDYIISGHKIENVHLSTSQKISLDLIEDISKESKNTLSYDLKTHDMVFFDNHRLFHGRTSFKDLNGNSKKRELLRVWIKTNLH
jgi:hypothetical protein